MRRYKVINPEPNKIDAHKGGPGMCARTNKDILSHFRWKFSGVGKPDSLRRRLGYPGGLITRRAVT